MGTHPKIDLISLLLGESAAVWCSELKKKVTAGSGDECVIAAMDQWYITYGEAEGMQISSSLMLKKNSCVTGNLDDLIGVTKKLWDPGGFHQRLEGKPHLKRWGMSWTGPPNSPVGRPEDREQPVTDKEDRERNRHRRTDIQADDILPLLAFL
jgi:hypothetical protein